MKNNKKKIMHVLPSNSFSGAENVVCTIIENNDEYEMYYCCPRGPIEEILKKRGIKYIPLEKFSPRIIKKEAIKNKIDIMHAHDYKASFACAISGFKGRIISQLHTNWDFNTSWNKYTIIYNMLINRFYKIVAVSPEIVEKSVFAKKHLDKFVVITNVVDKKRVISKSKEFKTKKYDLVYCGRLSPIKRPQIIIEVTNKLSKKYPTIKTCIIGKGDLSEECFNLIEKYNLKNNIDMLGFKSNPFPYIKNSKVSILPSLHEGLPMSVIESMILGVPVINSGVDGLSKLFHNNPEFICQTVDEYVDKIYAILKGDDSYSKECESIIKGSIDMKKYINKLNKLYD